MVKTCTVPPLAMNIFDLISTIIKVLYNKLKKRHLSFNRSYNYDLLKDKCLFLFLH